MDAICFHVKAAKVRYYMFGQPVTTAVKIDNNSSNKNNWNNNKNNDVVVG